jgi:hypothetical protein
MFGCTWHPLLPKGEGGRGGSDQGVTVWNSHGLGCAILCGEIGHARDDHSNTSRSWALEMNENSPKSGPQDPAAISM